MDIDSSLDRCSLNNQQLPTGDANREVHNFDVGCLQNMNKPVLLDMEDNHQQPSVDLPVLKTWKDRVKPDPMPHFHELEDIDFSQPPPGTFRFPNSEFENGTRKPFKQLHDRSDILPPKDEPYFVQIQAYCQRWTVWAATIDDDGRRREVLDLVLTKMLDAWKFGVLHGHYKLGPFEAAEKERLLKESRSTKRTVDTARKAAPFVAESGLSKEYNIVNSELEKAGITMQMINDRIANGGLDEGEVLLQTMIDRLQRQIELSDWKQNTRFSFRAGVHSRNLFMYALWEVQRCRKLVEMLEQKLKGNASIAQQKAWNTRIDTNRTRSMQHLALAIELNVKEPIDKIETSQRGDDVRSNSEIEIAEHYIPANSDQHAMETSSYSKQTEHRISPDPSTGTIGDRTSAEDNLDEHDAMAGVVADTDFDFGNHNMQLDLPEFPTISTLPALPDLPPEFSFDSMFDPPSGGKRFSDITNNCFDTPSKKPKLGQQAHPWQDSPFSSSMVGTSSLKSIDPRYMTGNTLTQNELIHKDDRNDNFRSSAQQDFEQARRNEEGRRRYLAEIWFSKIDNLLQQHGRDHLKWPLNKWSDVRAILVDLGIDSAQRNEYLREYKRGLAARGLSPRNATDPLQPSQSQQPQQPKLTLKIPTQPDISDQFSDRVVNTTRGFSFRCLPEASAEQRARLDDLINDYVTEIIANRYRRHGKYIVIHDPEHPDRMPIAHGFWNHKDKTHVSDELWFYEGDPIPEDFDRIALHIYDFEEPPPKTPKRSNRKQESGDRYNSTTRGESSSAKMKKRTGRRPDATSSRYTHEISTFDDPNDSDFDPRR